MTSCERAEASWRVHVWITQECQLNFSAHCFFSFLRLGLFEEKDDLLMVEVSRPDDLEPRKVSTAGCHQLKLA